MARITKPDMNRVDFIYGSNFEDHYDKHVNLVPKNLAPEFEGRPWTDREIGFWNQIMGATGPTLTKSEYKMRHRQGIADASKAFVTNWKLRKNEPPKFIRPKKRNHVFADRDCLFSIIDKCVKKPKRVFVSCYVWGYPSRPPRIRNFWPESERRNEFEKWVDIYRKTPFPHPVEGYPVAVIDDVTDF